MGCQRKLNFISCFVLTNMNSSSYTQNMNLGSHFVEERER